MLPRRSHAIFSLFLKTSNLSCKFRHLRRNIAVFIRYLFKSYFDLNNSNKICLHFLLWYCVKSVQIRSFFWSVLGHFLSSVVFSLLASPVRLKVAIDCINWIYASWDDLCSLDYNKLKWQKYLQCKLLQNSLRRLFSSKSIYFFHTIFSIIKGILMKIWKFANIFVFIWK